ncbi:hypothetical protein C8J57DRAFT_1257386 [Mycena rebaudengoi]|nr:hypothetical protein C8J57DRAFT_1257386 [Mycena rebaudengoi]
MRTAAVPGRLVASRRTTLVVALGRIMTRHRPRIFCFRQRPSQPPPTAHHTSRRAPPAPYPVPTARARPLSQCKLLLQKSALVAFPHPSAPQPAPPACAATAVAVPHRIPLARRLLARGKSIIFGAPLGPIPKTTHGATGVPTADGSPSPSRAPRSSPPRLPPSTIIPLLREARTALPTCTSQNAQRPRLKPLPPRIVRPPTRREPSPPPPPPPPPPLGDYDTHPARPCGVGTTRRAARMRSTPRSSAAAAATHGQHGGDMQPLRA